MLPLLQLSGTNATFICEAEANPQHTIEWTKDNQELFNNTKILITGLGTARSVLTIIDLELSDTGSYSCFAENVHGNDSTTDELFVQGIYSIQLYFLLIIILTYSVYSSTKFH